MRHERDATGDLAIRPDVAGEVLRLIEEALRRAQTVVYDASVAEAPGDGGRLAALRLHGLGVYALRDNDGVLLELGAAFYDGVHAADHCGRGAGAYECGGRAARGDFGSYQRDGADGHSHAGYDAVHNFLGVRDFLKLFGAFLALLVDDLVEFLVIPFERVPLHEPVDVGHGRCGEVDIGEVRDIAFATASDGGYAPGVRVLYVAGRVVADGFQFGLGLRIQDLVDAEPEQNIIGGLEGDLERSLDKLDRDFDGLGHFDCSLHDSERGPGDCHDAFKSPDHALRYVESGPGAGFSYRADDASGIARRRRHVAEIAAIVNHRVVSGQSGHASGVAGRRRHLADVMADGHRAPRAFADDSADTRVGLDVPLVDGVVDHGERRSAAYAAGVLAGLDRSGVADRERSGLGLAYGASGKPVRAHGTRVGAISEDALIVDERLRLRTAHSRAPDDASDTLVSRNVAVVLA